MAEVEEPQKRSRKAAVFVLIAIAVTVLIGLAVYNAFDVNGSRARKLAQDTQELADEMDATSRSIDPHCCGWKPHWENSGVSVNAIDGAKTEFLSMDSTDPDGTEGGSVHYAQLRICFKNGKMCGGTDLGVGIAVNGMVAPADEESEYRTEVRLKFDDEKPANQTWGISDDHEALFPSGRESQFLVELTRHKKLVIEFSYYEEAPRTVTFDLGGLAEKANAENLEISAAEQRPAR